MTTWDDLDLTTEHAEYLESHAITPEMADSEGIRSITRAEDLPSEFRKYGDRIVPAILFNWTEPNGSVHHQLKVPEGFSFPNGDKPKYLWAKGRVAQLGEIRKVETAETVLIVEGTKQSRAAASWAPPEFAVYGIAGCWAWSSEGVPTPDLSVVEDRNVVIILDADAATNLDVYTAGEKLKTALEMEFAKNVSFAHVPGGAKSGLDDYLGSREEGRRFRMIRKLVDDADKKPASSKPKPKAKSDEKKAQVFFEEEETEELSNGAVVKVLSDGRREVFFDGDHLKFAETCLEVVKNRWDGSRIFCFGGELAERRERHEVADSREGQMSRIDKAYVRWPLLQAMRPMKTDSRSGEMLEVEFSSVVCDMVLSRAHDFSPLEKLSSIPFIRPDGTICQESGYDKETMTYLDLSEEFEGLLIPDNPSKKAVRDAVDLILNELLHDFPFAGEADRANALALFLTPFVRGMIPTVPLAVIDGREPGVGKNLLADCLSLVVMGKDMEPLTYPRDNDEMRKTITATFRSGTEIFCFDEAHHVTGEFLAQALTAAVWRDRTLGKSDSVGYPNKVTWMSLGNQVQIGGDLGRRVYRINLAYDKEDPASRPRSHYRHPDLKEWLLENRRELVKACLILVRAWFAANKPRPDVPNMGSFEKWLVTVGGILEVAGVEGFMANVQEWKAESDYDRQLWVAHFNWLRMQFQDEPFTISDVRKKLMEVSDADAPPGMSDTSAPNYVQKLGSQYRSMQDRIVDGFRLSKSTMRGHGNKTRWTISVPGADSSNEFFAASGEPMDPFK